MYALSRFWLAVIIEAPRSPICRVEDWRAQPQVGSDQSSPFRL
jgi:hypothetical protein